MTQLELARLAREISQIYFIPWHQRDRKRLKTPLRSEFPGGDDEVYGYVVNEWIPGQPDSEALMKLFILCQFQMAPFFKIIIQPPPGRRKIRDAA